LNLLENKIYECYFSTQRKLTEWNNVLKYNHKIKNKILKHLFTGLGKASRVKLELDCDMINRLEWLLNYQCLLKQN